MMVQNPIVDLDLHDRTAVQQPPPCTPGKDSTPRARFCTQCGSALSAEIRFCTACGARVEGSHHQPADAQQPVGSLDTNTTYSVRVIEGPEKERHFGIPETGCDAGRGSDNGIVLTDLSLSRHHCRFDRFGKELWVRDLGSANGTHVNGVEVTQCQIRGGDRIIIGDTQLLVEEDGGAPSPFPPALPAMAAPLNAFQFPFEGMSKTGQKFSGTVVAMNKSAAIREVEKLGYVPIRISDPIPLPGFSEEPSDASQNDYPVTGQGTPDYLSTVLSRIALGLGIVIRTLFSFKGRITRLTFGTSMLMVAMTGAIVTQLIALCVSSGRGMREDQQMTYFILVYTLVMPVVCWASIALQVKRWHDRGKPGSMIFINFIPLVGIVWALAELGFFKGASGQNSYGLDPHVPSGVTLREELFSFRGRISCRGYWQALGKQFLLMTALIIVSSFLSFISILDAGTGMFVFSLFALGCVGFWLWSTIAIQIKRLHDRGKSGWLTLANVIPVAGGLWLFLELGVLRGVDGDNSYGSAPKSL